MLVGWRLYVLGSADLTSEQAKVQRERPLVVKASTAISVILCLVVGNLIIAAGCFPAVAQFVPCDCDLKEVIIFDALGSFWCTSSRVSFVTKVFVADKIPRSTHLNNFQCNFHNDLPPQQL